MNTASITEQNINLFNWDVVSKPLYSSGNESIIKTIELEDYFAFYKKDLVSNVINEQDVICIHKNTYDVLNNLKLSRIANKLSRLTGMKIHDVSEYNDGKYVMIFLEHNLHINIAGFPIKTYLTILNNFNQDYSLSFGISMRDIRCNNAFSQISNNIKIGHAINMDFRIADLMSMFIKWKKNIKNFEKEFNVWSKISFSKKLQIQAVNYILGINYKTDSHGNVSYDKDIYKIKLNKQLEIIKCINKESAILGDNLWGFFNGITYYNTHVKKDYSRNFNLFGLSNKINKIAYDLCCLNKYNSSNKLVLPEDISRYN